MQVCTCFYQNCRKLLEVEDVWTKNFSYDDALHISHRCLLETPEIRSPTGSEMPLHFLMGSQVGEAMVKSGFFRNCWKSDIWLAVPLKLVHLSVNISNGVSRIQQNREKHANNISQVRSEQSSRRIALVARHMNILCLEHSRSSRVPLLDSKWTGNVYATRVEGWSNLKLYFWELEHLLLAGSGKGLLANNTFSAERFTKAFYARGIESLSQYSQSWRALRDWLVAGHGGRQVLRTGTLF